MVTISLSFISLLMFSVSAFIHSRKVPSVGISFGSRLSSTPDLIYAFLTQRSTKDFSCAFNGCLLSIQLINDVISWHLSAIISISSSSRSARSKSNGLIYDFEPFANFTTVPSKASASFQYSLSGSITIISALGSRKNTSVISRFTKNDLPAPGQASTNPDGFTSPVIRSNVMILCDSTFRP